MGAGRRLSGSPTFRRPSWRLQGAVAGELLTGQFGSVQGQLSPRERR